MTNITYITLLQVIEAFAAQHLQIKRFHSDFPDNIPDFSNAKEDFPILFVSPTNSIFQVNTNLFNVRVYCFDLITEGRENINSILSDTHSILSDLQVYLRDGNIPAIDLLTSSNVTPLNNQLLDYAAGWYVDIQVEVSTSDLCAIPFSTPPIISNSICNSIVFDAGVPASRKLTINNVTYDLSEDRTWVIFEGTADQFVKGDGTYDSRVLEDSANKQNTLALDGTGIKYPTVDAVNLVLNQIAKAALNTGFLTTNDLFTLYPFDDFTLGIQGSTNGIIFKPLLEAPNAGVSDAIVNITDRTVPLSEIGIVDDGFYIKFVGYRQSDDSILFSDVSFEQIDTTCQLGLVLVKFTGGTTTFIDANRDTINKPNIAAYSNLEETAISMQSSVVVAPANTNDLHIQNSQGALIGVSVNWQGLNNDLLPVVEATPTFFTYIVPLIPNTYPIVSTEFIDPTQYFNGNILTPLTLNTNASIQRFLLTVQGTIVVQYGEFQYNTFNDARNNIFVAEFTEILPAKSAIEIGRVALVKSATTLTDETQAFFVTTGSGSGGGSNTTTVQWGNITGDITNQTDLVEYIDEQIDNSINGTANVVAKFDGVDGLTESNIIDNGTFIEIATNARVNTLTLGTGNQNNNPSNTVFGSFALATNTTGGQNTAIGNNALLFGNGNSNTALGVSALENLATGNQNTAVGDSALRNTDRNENVAIGEQAGSLTNSFLPLNPAQSIYIGAKSKGLNVLETNSIVIGYGSVGNGSDTVTIGNSSILNNFFYGTINADAFKVYGGLSTQFLKANGTLDNSTYLTNVTLVGDVFGTGTNLINTTLQTVNVAGVYTTVLTDVKGRVLSGFNDTTIYEPAANKQNAMTFDGTGVKFPTVDAVNSQVNNLTKATLNTGFLVVDDDFELYVFDNSTLGIQGSSTGILFKPLLDTLPFTPNGAIRQITSRTIPLNTITLPNDGNFIKFVGYRQSDDTVVFSDNSFQSNDAVCQLGLVLVQKSGLVVTFIDPTRNVVNKPDIAGYSNLEQTAIGLSTSVSVAPADSNDLKIQNSEGELVGISVDWKGFNNDSLTIDADDETTFAYIYVGLTQNAYPITDTLFIDPTKYWDGLALVDLTGANNASVQRVLLTVNGNIIVQYGEFQYTTFNDAKNAVFIAPFTDILPAGSYVEIARIVLRKSATNLNNDTDAVFVSSGAGGGGGSATQTTFWGTIQGDINTQTDLVNFVNFRVTGTTNFISKFDATGLTESIIQDNGINLGIGISADTATTATITFGNQFDRTISIQDSANAITGKTLVVKAGKASSSGVTTQDLQALGQTTRAWVGASINTTNGDRYACVYTGADADVYKQTGGVGNFVALGLPNRNYRGVAVNSTNGDVYVCVLNGDIYKQTGGVGAFNALGLTPRAYTDIAINSTNNDVYTTVDVGDIYKQTNSTGAFVGLGQSSRNWEGIDINETTNDVFACVSGGAGQIYKQTGGVGTFTSLGQTLRNYQNLGVNSTNGDVTVCVFGGDLYRLFGGVGTLTPLGQTARNYNGLAVNNLTGAVLACVNTGDLYFSTGINATAVDTNGGKLQLKAGQGKGAGQSRIELITGAKVASSSAQQQERLAVQIDEDANLTVVGNIIKSGGTSTQFLKANGSVDSTSYQPLLSNPITGTGTRTTNFIPKFASSNTVQNSRISDDGAFLGIDAQNALAFDIQFGYLPAQRTIAIEDSDNASNGKELVLKAGRTTNTATVSTNLVPLGQGNRTWDALDVNYNNNDVYASVNNGDIYKQTGGVGNFVATGLPARQYSCVAVNSNTLDVYTSVFGGDIYKQTGGVGAFVALGQTSRQWGGIAINSVTNDVYCTTSGGDIYKQTGGVGNFIALGQTSRSWYDIAVNQNTGDVWAVVNTGDVYKQTGGVGSFVSQGLNFTNYTGIHIDQTNNDIWYCTFSGVIYKQIGGVGAQVNQGQVSRSYAAIALNQVTRVLYAGVSSGDLYKSFATLVSQNAGSKQWTDITVNSTNGDVYAVNNPTGSDVWKQTGGVGAFVAQGLASLNYIGITVNRNNNDVYLTNNGGDIYKQTGGIGAFNPLGQTSRSWYYIEVNPVNNDVYATVLGGDIYKQTGGVGNFIALGAGTRNWTGIGINQTTGDVWASVDAGDIYKQTGGVGAFVAQGQANRNWRNIFVNHLTNEITICDGNSSTGDVYRLYQGGTTFLPLLQNVRNYGGVAYNFNSDKLYVTTNIGEIYFSQFNATGTANLNGGTLTLKAGLGKGTGQSRVRFITGQKTVSGTNMQVETERLRIDEDGISTFTGKVIINSGNLNSIEGNSTNGGIVQFSTGNNNAAIFGVAYGLNSFGVVAENQNSTGTALFAVNAFGGDIAKFNGNSGQVARIDNDGNVGIGASFNDASAKLQIDTVTQGFLPPRMTETQRNSIPTPAIGLMVYQTDNAEGVYVYTSIGWRQLAF